jgi:GDPmannose 4,6-dehydratase
VLGMDWQQHVELDNALFRPSETHPLQADASKARKVLGWKPTVLFDELVELMVKSDMENVQQ